MAVRVKRIKPKTKTKTKLDIYRELVKHCNLVFTARSTDYLYRTEYWKRGNIQYTVVLKVNPRIDRVVNIYGKLVKAC